MRLPAFFPLLLSLVACGESQPSDSPIDPPVPAAGSSGAAGQGGASGSSGQAGAGGSAGEAGGGGTGGAGASGEGGAAGQAGAGGEAGSGTSGQSGSSGTSGQGGEGGAGGEAGAGAGGDAGGAGDAGAAGSSGTSGQAGGAGAAGEAGVGGADPGGAAGAAGAGAGGAGMSGAGMGGAGMSGAGMGGAGMGGGGPNLAFVTSVAFDPVATAGQADQLCTQLASQAGYAGKFVAWLSTEEVSAKTRLAGASGWVRVDGLPFANSLQDLEKGEIFYPLRVDETGALVPQGTQVATGTDAGGKAGLNCENWTSTGGEHFAGDAAGGTELWTRRSQVSCILPMRYYCFQVDHGVEVAPPPVPAVGRRIFLTKAPFLPGGGLSAADKLCADEASAANLPGEYVALLATDQKTAASRVTLDARPWFRPDGVKVAEPKGLLGSVADLLAPPNVTADASQYATARAWSGDSSPVQDPANKFTCDDWTSTLGPTFLGDSGPTDSSWFGGALTSCEDKGNRLRCVEK